MLQPRWRTKNYTKLHDTGKKTCFYTSYHTRLKRQWKNFNIVVRDLQPPANSVIFYSKQGKIRMFYV